MPDGNEIAVDAPEDIIGPQEERFRPAIQIPPIEWLAAMDAHRVRQPGQVGRNPRLQLQGFAEEQQWNAAQGLLNRAPPAPVQRGRINEAIINNELVYYGECPFSRKEEMDNAKVGNYFGMNQKAGLFGVEIELEGDLHEYHSKFWETKKDGSLRGGYEYVFTYPLVIEEAKAAIIMLQEHLVNTSKKINYSFRTSVHVHVNVLDLTRKQLNCFLYLSHMLEDALVNYSGASRVGNRFCLRSKDAEIKAELLKSFFSFKKGIKVFNNEEVKYSAINLASISNFGSVEFRSMRGTVDKDILFPWLDVLKRIKEYSLNTTVKEMSESFRIDPVLVVQGIFGEHFDKFNYPSLEQDLKEAYCRFIELPYIKVI